MSYANQGAESDSAGIVYHDIRTTDVTNCADWDYFKEVHQEYRVVGIELAWTNLYNQTGSAKLTGAGAVGVFHQPLSGTPTLDQILQNADHKLVTCGNKWSIQWKARGAEELAWTAPSALINHGGFLGIIPGCTASSAMGNRVVTFTIQFKGRK